MTVRTTVTLRSTVVPDISFLVKNKSIHLCNVISMFLESFLLNVTWKNMIKKVRKIVSFLVWNLDQNKVTWLCLKLLYHSKITLLLLRISAMFTNPRLLDEWINFKGFVKVLIFCIRLGNLNVSKYQSDLSANLTNPYTL